MNLRFFGSVTKGRSHAFPHIPQNKAHGLSLARKPGSYLSGNFTALGQVLTGVKNSRPHFSSGFGGHAEPF